ncbi:ATP phosphoribosyltransferase [Hypnocyclicus thermotrophus]|uniref:ATP phosphoribosyltransferase n=1 Tax=Hypnocyclicus thermotrophus TaxID=1627895 RepID=A0AA46I5Q8_9FUSO|nr:ATP phosphoribosyltransferase [Hypnocyclicus thermotrophus]TDT71458.1 ATP phosphoribosyltransferase [Hypnocyclicus thermotrophus]
MYLNIALPKGRLGEKSYEILKKLGYSSKDYENKDRKLVFINVDKKIKYFLVKASDVPVYVERGAADIGVVGKDVLMESKANVYEILDLGFGKCRFAVAAPIDFIDNYEKKLVVATKYINVAREYFEKKEREIDLIKLNGSVELGPLVNLSDVIVDIVETGSTLKANNLEEREKICDISARLIVNRNSYRFKNNIINKLIKEIKGEIKND